jgi:hypothetical protein
LAGVTADTAGKTQVFTDSDREMLAEIHAMLAQLGPYLPLLDKAARLLNNPAMRWKGRHG